MKHYRRTCGIWICFFWLGLWGCAGLTGSGVSPEQAGEQVESARTLLETAKSLPPEKLPPEELVQATDSFERAENVLRTGDPEGAVRSAEESIGISRRIISRFYSTTIAELARRAEQELSRKKAVEPDHPLTDRISRMEQVAAFGDELEKDPQIIAIGEVIRDLDDVLAVVTGLQNNWSRTVDSDTAFDPGGWTLSEKGSGELQEFIRTVFQDVTRAWPGQPVTLHIRVTGYTDQLNFGPKNRIMTRLIEGTDGQVPESDPERRQFLNRRLSRYRAQAMADYIHGLIEEKGQQQADIRVNMEVAGRGEEIPEDIPAPFPASDVRRRICRIHVYAVDDGPDSNG